MGLFMGLSFARRVWRRFITERLAPRLIAKAERRQPDFLIAPNGAPYLYRWWQIPKNPLLNVYLHKTVADDDNRALHDHPYWNVSIILRGAYFEIMPYRESGYAGGDAVKAVRREAGDIVFRRATLPHRLVLPSGTAACWSLFITGPRIRDWGFFCPRGWVHENIYRAKHDGGASIGRGCD